MSRRVKINLELAIDLDMFPGFGYAPDSFVDMVRSQLERSVAHYNPELTWTNRNELNKD